MEELVDGGLPVSGSEVAVWYDREEDVVVLQYDNIDVNLYERDFNKLVELLMSAKDNLEAMQSHPENNIEDLDD